jgi:hypothetical protein
VAGGGGRRRNDEPHRRGRRLRLPGLPQQEDRPTRAERTPMQPARGGEVELLRIAADFEDDGRKPFQLGGLLGDPQRIQKLWRLGDQHLVRLDAEAAAQARRIGHAGLAEDFGGADPEQGDPLHCPRQQKPGHCQGKTACRSGVARLGAMDLGQRGQR